jgi:hypothetical protein
VNATLTSTPLTATDRCDRCGARAYIRVVLPVGELLFCAHHGRAHDEAIKAQAVEVHDHTQTLEETVATAPTDER